MDFSTVQKGKLSFKSSGTKKKKKKKKKRKNTDSKVEVTEKKQKQEDAKEEATEIPTEGMTESERQFLLAREKREKALIKSKIKKTHREKIKEFNDYLGNLTEHYDIPRVGPG
mmetsp:Transcript_6465/g.8913  ORF Transcript_6465/g.8913 Transcript_6465/m.8913 type:complete len:113 (-) Transcript_6465:90-428(-)|eukprot:CAMPEP_0184487322 /NCGR_PEP_ID=MMETSP0113_2-20130426/9765_1 /TAXON_ID=91329 /ORGANISM="Norrisiella sphaerica, Strain BC52" /LENGTH=112 /DNA_ID=CAMNT_0026869581 /DNA_START=56 /DNA_END=394 /DNA_ORIENTATION=-